MKNYKVKLTIRRMGRQCQSCKQSFEGEFYAASPEDAVSQAKSQSGADPDTNQFQIDYVRGVS